MPYSIHFQMLYIYHIHMMQVYYILQCNTIGPHIMSISSFGIIAQNSKIVVAKNSLAKYYGFEQTFGLMHTNALLMQYHY